MAPIARIRLVRRPKVNRRVTFILYVREDEELAGLDAVTALQEAGFEVHTANVEHVHLETTLRDRVWRLVLFDIVLADGPGFRLCSRLRSMWAGPVMIILRGPATSEIMRTFVCGADMYLLAPYSGAELVGRARALLRRPARRNDSWSPAMGRSCLL